MDAKSLLKKTRLFHELSPFELLKVEEISRRRFLARGDTIISEGDQFEADSSIYVIASGAVKAAVRMGTSELVLAILAENEIIGEISFVDGMTRTAEVTALADTELLKIDRDKLAGLLKEDRDIAVKFYRSLCHVLAGKLRATNRKAIETLEKSR